MFVESVVEFCAVISADPELQSEIKAALRTGEGVSRFVALSQARGCHVTEEDVLATFAAERRRRGQLMDDVHGETVIQRRDDAAPDEPPGVGGLRSIVVSGDWEIGPNSSDSDSVLD